MVGRLILVSTTVGCISGCGSSDAADDTPQTLPAPTVAATNPTIVDVPGADSSPPPVETDPVVATFDLEGCPDSPRAAVADKANQRYWLCAEGAAITDEIPMTTASSGYGLPPVGTYEVFARHEHAYGINGEPLERFIAFYTTPTGNRIAFHEVVDQDPATVGDLDQRGASSGCFRVREEDSIEVWNFLQIGDPVAIITN